MQHISNICIEMLQQYGMARSVHIHRAYSGSSVQCRDLEDLKQVLLTNVVGTFAVTKTFLPLLKQGKKKVIVNMSSDAGCLTQNASFIHDNRPSDAGMALSYRTSKVAVNMGKPIVSKS